MGSFFTKALILAMEHLDAGDEKSVDDDERLANEAVSQVAERPSAEIGKMGMIEGFACVANAPLPKVPTMDRVNARVGPAQ